MIKDRYSLLVISFIILMSVGRLNAQDLKGDELKSMEKYGGIKGDN